MNMNGTCGSTFERAPVDQLELDMKNPRIAKWVEMYGNQISAEQMSLALGAGDGQVDDNSPTFNSLRDAIKTNGGIIHPIIVNREAGGRLVVIEGNTRALIYREFKQQKLSGDWSMIPAMVYEGLSPRDIDAIRLQAHLVGREVPADKVGDQAEVRPPGQTVGRRLEVRLGRIGEREEPGLLVDAQGEKRGLLGREGRFLLPEEVQEDGGGRADLAQHLQAARDVLGMGRVVIVDVDLQPRAAHVLRQAEHSHVGTPSTAFPFRL